MSSSTEKPYTHHLSTAQLKPSENITWTDCLEKYKCARLSLPLDYTTPEGPKTEIALLLLPGNNTANHKGTIFLNPGGPGGSGTSLLQRAGDDISKIVGPEFDLLGFDPRGTGATTPSAQCFESETQYKQWSLQSLFTLIEPNANSLALARSREAVVGAVCERSLGGNGKEELGGTAAEWGPGRASQLLVIKDGTFLILFLWLVHEHAVCCDGHGENHGKVGAGQDALLGFCRSHPQPHYPQ